MHSPVPRLAGLAMGLMLLGLLGCQDASAPEPESGRPAFSRAETVTDVQVQKWDLTEVFLCTGEPVHWIGTAVFTFHELSNRGAPPPSDPGIQFLTFDVSINLVGVGEVSGEKYTFHSKLLDSFKSVDPTEPFPLVRRFLVRDRVTGPGGFVGYATTSVIFVVNPNGEVVIDRDEFTSECG